MQKKNVICKEFIFMEGSTLFHFTVEFRCENFGNMSLYISIKKYFYFLVQKKMLFVSNSETNSLSWKDQDYSVHSTKALCPH